MDKARALSPDRRAAPWRAVFAWVAAVYLYLTLSALVILVPMSFPAGWDETLAAAPRLVWEIYFETAPPSAAISGLV
jgi:hypothetical protein